MGPGVADSLRRRSYWSEEGKARHHLLGSIFGLLEEEDWRYSTDSGWNEWDVQIYGNFWWSLVLQTVTEYHGGAKCLTRAGLRYRFVPTTVIINLFLLSILIYRQLYHNEADLWLLIPYLCFILFLVVRARRLKKRLAELVDLAAYRSNMRRVLRRRRSESAGSHPA